MPARAQSQESPGGTEFLTSREVDMVDAPALISAG